MRRAAVLAVVALVASACGDFFPNPSNVVLPSGIRDYELDCGTVPRANCEARANRLVAQKRREQPANRVIRVRIEDDRGSYTLTFADGTSESMIVD